MTNDVTTTGAQPLALQESAAFPGYTNQQVDLIKTQIAKGANDDELKMFMYTAKRLGLDPFGKQIYLIPRWDNKLQKEVRTPQVSIDGFRVTAADTGELAGIDDVVFSENQEGKPTKATITVYRMVKDTRCPFTATARWEEYKQEFKDKTGNLVLSNFWAKMPFTMLGKCAEALALRKAFPKQLSGVYTTEEMAQATEVVHVVESEPAQEHPSTGKPLPKMEDYSKKEEPNGTQGGAGKGDGSGVNGNDEPFPGTPSYHTKPPAEPVNGSNVEVVDATPCNVAGCGGVMKLKHGPKGDFLGCSNYYSNGCKNTMPIV